MKVPDCGLTSSIKREIICYLKQQSMNFMKNYIILYRIISINGNPNVPYSRKNLQ